MAAAESSNPLGVTERTRPRLRPRPDLRCSNALSGIIFHLSTVEKRTGDLHLLRDDRRREPDGRGRSRGCGRPKDLNFAPRGVALEPSAHPRRRVVVAEADGVRADVAVEPVAAESDVEVGAGVRGAGGVRGGGGGGRRGLGRAARLRELASGQSSSDCTITHASSKRPSRADSSGTHT